MTKKRMPVAERQRETAIRSISILLRMAVVNRLDTDPMVRREAR
jgi:hypothetical protein